MTSPTPLPSPINNLPTVLLPSVLRTVVPIIYAFLVEKGVVEWLDPNDMWVTRVVTVVVTGLFYICLRVLERHWSKIGWLLGYAAAPIYVQGQVLATAEVPNEQGTVTLVQTDSGA